ncbi:2,6-dihydropseudooxynicotine hydrolase [Fusarium austroafricanum]|uniref:2,6-dihydropseudooxynicotine hydrolase n=1 Tax=Fusarium austroafricanum TaxID=2364996 RepID=A0A8H4KJW1_9HYPO|nr:2,6-dihydropseudooxynicotine hydrolase [Fusarium austroafricanum]
MAGQVSESTLDSKGMYQLSNDSSFHFELLRDISLAPYEGADIGEVLVAANKVVPGNFESFHNAFIKLATRVHSQAKVIDSVKYPISSRNAFFRAATYYRSADFFFHGNRSDPRINDIWVKHLDAFNAAIALLPIPGQRIELPSTDNKFKIPAIFYGSDKKEARPTIILGNGYDGSQEEMFHVMGKAILERGMNFITYEGPGQPTVRRKQNLGFIHEWEKVVTPVVDYLLTRPEVDPNSIGLLEYSFGGMLSPRAAAFEHRLAAVFAIDGVYDFGQALLENLTPQMRKLFESHKAKEVDSMTNNLLQNPSTPTSIRWAIQQGLWAFNEKSAYTWLLKSQQYNLTGLTDHIRAPVFVGSAENDMFFPGQARLLADSLGSKATFRSFGNAEGAGEYFQAGASVLLSQTALDWFAEIVHSHGEYLQHLEPEREL